MSTHNSVYVCYTTYGILSNFRNLNWICIFSLCSPLCISFYFGNAIQLQFSNLIGCCTSHHLSCCVAPHHRHGVDYQNVSGIRFELNLFIYWRCVASFLPLVVFVYTSAAALHNLWLTNARQMLVYTIRIIGYKGSAFFMLSFEYVSWSYARNV